MNKSEFKDINLIEITVFISKFLIVFKFNRFLSLFVKKV